MAYHSNNQHEPGAEMKKARFTWLGLAFVTIFVAGGLAWAGIVGGWQAALIVTLSAIFVWIGILH